LVLAVALAASCAVTSAGAGSRRDRSIAELKPLATIKLGRTADWVAVTADAVWVGSTGPDAVNRIDPATNTLAASVVVPGRPCAGLAAGSGSLWVPLCGPKPALARIDLATGRVLAVLDIGPAAPESGIAAGPDAVWLIIDKSATLVRIDPADNSVRQRIAVPAGSFNPLYSDGIVWVTQAGGAALTAVDAESGAVVATIKTGPHPRFLTAGAGAVWTLNQGDGSLSRVDAARRKLIAKIPLGTPGPGGDIAFAEGLVWTTFSKVPLAATDVATNRLRRRWRGAGGDSLGIGFGAIWLTDYKAGTIARLDLNQAVRAARGK